MRKKKHGLLALRHVVAPRTGERFPVLVEGLGEFNRSSGDSALTCLWHRGRQTFHRHQRTGCAAPPSFANSGISIEIHTGDSQKDRSRLEQTDRTDFQVTRSMPPSIAGPPLLHPCRCGAEARTRGHADTRTGPARIRSLCRIACVTYLVPRRLDYKGDWLKQLANRKLAGNFFCSPGAS